MAEHLNPQTWNLRCSAGHMHFSPTPKEWVGMPCGRPLDKLGEGYRAKRCDKPMRRVSQ